MIVRADVPERFFREQLGDRQVDYRPAGFDCGCVQQGSLTVLPAETIALYTEIEAANNSRLPDEVAFLKRERADCVVSDIAPFPLYAAREAGLPGIAISNFTWCDIYAPFAISGADRALIERIARQYSAATLALVLPFALPSMSSLFACTQQIPLVARRGRNLRPQLVKSISANRIMQSPYASRFALVYLGVWGVDIDWNALREFNDWIFLTFEAPAVDTPNVCVLDRQTWSFDDVCASIDLVVAKTGYGVVASCMANGTPLAYVGRDGFAEHPVLANALREALLGIEIPVADFVDARWRDALDRSDAMPRRESSIDTAGAQVASDRICSLLDSA